VKKLGSELSGNVRVELLRFGEKDQKHRVVMSPQSGSSGGPVLRVTAAEVPNVTQSGAGTHESFTIRRVDEWAMVLIPARSIGG
jgi:hypothetical protein